mgnify:CR=1 FL=1
MADILNIIHSKKAQMPKKEQFLAEYISSNIKTVIKSSIQKLSKDTLFFLITGIGCKRESSHLTTYSAGSGR